MNSFCYICAVKYFCNYTFVFVCAYHFKWYYIRLFLYLLLTIDYFFFGNKITRANRQTMCEREKKQIILSVCVCVWMLCCVYVCVCVKECSDGVYLQLKTIMRMRENEQKNAEPIRYSALFFYLYILITLPKRMCIFNRAIAI